MADRMVTYRYADGELVAGEFSFVTDLDYFEDDVFDPVEVVEERWHRKSMRTLWVLPTFLGPCMNYLLSNDEPCDEDAVGWWNVGNRPLSLCQEHAGRFPRWDA